MIFLRMSILTINKLTNGVEKLLQDINPSKASEPEGIPNRILKECASQIAPSLTVILCRNQSTLEHYQRTGSTQTYHVCTKKEIHMPRKTIDRYH
jgi:hypothetical protein